MKRILAIAAALCAMSGSIQAQDSTTGTTDDYVLQQARDKHSAATAPTGTIVTIEITQAPELPPGVPPERQHPYTPIVLGWVPGVSYPFGVYDTSLSAAPIGAITGSVEGLQGAGIFNITDGHIRGLQGAGVFNIVAGEVRGAQGAGVFNIADGIRGAQGSGVFNIAGRVNGIQAAGVFNIADEMHGVQAAGVFNIAGKATGTMIGLVNIADELDGVAIGLINIIGNGIYDVALDYQFDTGMAYATWRSGTPALYASFSAGQPAGEILTTTQGLTVGAGLGHRFRFMFMTADIELGAETPVDPESFDRIVACIETGDEGELGPWLGSFGTLRASFGLGRRTGYGPYIGIKADFAPAGSDDVPLALRSAFGSAVPYSMRIFGTDIEFWPKWFLGIRF